MPKTFPLAVKERALELYLQGSSPKDVSEVLRDEFTNDLTQSTVYAWVKHEGWEEKKQLIYPWGSRFVLSLFAEIFY